MKSSYIFLIFSVLILLLTVVGNGSGMVLLLLVLGTILGIILVIKRKENAWLRAASMILFLYTLLLFVYAGWAGFRRWASFEFAYEPSAFEYYIEVLPVFGPYFLVFLIALVGFFRAESSSSQSSRKL